MIIHPIFPSFLAIEDKLDFDHDLLEKYCKEKIYSGEKYLNGNHKQSDNLNLSDPELQSLISHILISVNNIGKEIGLKDGQIIKKAWANINDNVAIMQPHSHTNSVFSCVYYVKGFKESGNLTFRTPITCIDYVFDGKYVEQETDFTTTEIMIPPVPGSLVIFPSWLQHYVRNSSSGERISMAFETGYA
jgi:hypothetical protein